MSRLTKSDDKKINQFLNLIEELMWFIDTKKLNDVKDAPLIIRKIIDQKVLMEAPEKYFSVNPNKNMLVGILPNFFQDLDIFKTNSDISDFAHNILKIEISRPEKRSKYELIGLIACEVNVLNDEDLANLVATLISLTSNIEKRKKLKEAKRASDFSWNSFLENYRL